MIEWLTNWREWRVTFLAFGPLIVVCAVFGLGFGQTCFVWLSAIWVHVVLSANE